MPDTKWSEAISPLRCRLIFIIEKIMPSFTFGDRRTRKSLARDDNNE